jgi:hypothetical protein
MMVGVHIVGAVMVSMMSKKITVTRSVVRCSYCNGDGYTVSGPYSYYVRGGTSSSDTTVRKCPHCSGCGYITR